MLSGAQVTRLSPYGGIGAPYGSFAAKSVNAKTYSKTFTRLGSDGSIAAPYGSFAGKSAGSPFGLSVSSPIALSGSVLTLGDLEFDNGWEFEPRLAIPEIAGGLALSGDIQISATALNLVASAINVSGALAASGNIQWVQNLTASPLGLSGSLAATGDIQITPGTPVNLVASPIPVAGALSLSGDLQVGTVFDLSTFALPIAGAITTFGNIDNIEIGNPFDIGLASALLTGSVSVVGNVTTNATYTHDSRHRIGPRRDPVNKGRIGKGYSPRKRGGPRRF